MSAEAPVSLHPEVPELSPHKPDHGPARSAHWGQAPTARLAAGLGVLVVLGLVLYPLVIRPWHLRWGTTDEEIVRPMPLDDRVVAPTYVTHRAVTIQAAPEAVWPWLVQIGEGRAAFYSYDLIERVMGMKVQS